MSELKKIELKEGLKPAGLNNFLVGIGNQIGLSCDIEYLSDSHIGGAFYTKIKMYKNGESKKSLTALNFDSDKGRCFYLRDFGKAFEGFNETYEDIFLKTVGNNGLIQKTL